MCMLLLNFLPKCKCGHPSRVVLLFVHWVVDFEQFLEVAFKRVILISKVQWPIPLPGMREGQLGQLQEGKKLCLGTLGCVPVPFLCLKSLSLEWKLWHGWPLEIKWLIVTTELLWLHEVVNDRHRWWKGGHSMWMRNATMLSAFSLPWFSIMRTRPLWTAAPHSCACPRRCLMRWWKLWPAHLWWVPRCLGIF